jgi:hypothetical protein
MKRTCRSSIAMSAVGVRSARGGFTARTDTTVQTRNTYATQLGCRYLNLLGLIGCSSNVCSHLKKDPRTLPGGWLYRISMRRYEPRGGGTARIRREVGIAEIGEVDAIAARPRPADKSAEIAAGPTKHRWGRWWPRQIRCRGDLRERDGGNGGNNCKRSTAHGSPHVTDAK